MELEKTIESFKRYINSQEQKLDDYYRMDEEFYKDEIEQLELSLKLLRTILNHLTKQEKIIDRMAKALHLFIWENDEKIMITSKPKVSCHTLSIEEIKQYFEKKIEEE